MNKYYVFIQDGKINGCGMCPCTGENLQSIEVSKEIYNNIVNFGNNYYIFENGEIIQNPEYEAIKEQEEKLAQIEAIKEKLAEIDKQSQRSARAIALCYTLGEAPNSDDVEKLTELEQAAEVLREELQYLIEGDGNNDN